MFKYQGYFIEQVISVDSLTFGDISLLGRGTTATLLCRDHKGRLTNPLGSFSHTRLDGRCKLDNLESTVLDWAIKEANFAGTGIVGVAIVVDGRIVRVYKFSKDNLLAEVKEQVSLVNAELGSELLTVVRSTSKLDLVQVVYNGTVALVISGRYKMFAVQTYTANLPRDIKQALGKVVSALISLDY